MLLEKDVNVLELFVKQFVIQSSQISLGQIVCEVQSRTLT